jgi:hypothetical protein
MRVRFHALALYALFVPSVTLAQYAPVCDVTCEPDPESPTYAFISGSRTNPENSREKTYGSESYSYAIPILNLPGRAGLDLNLTLYYNSRVWTSDRANRIALNADHDSPSYGFRLGFGFLKWTDSGYILTLHDGSKHKLTAVSGTSYYDSTDSSYIRYDVTTEARKLYFKNRRWMQYEVVPESQPWIRPRSTAP